MLAIVPPNFTLLSPLTLWQCENSAAVREFCLLRNAVLSKFSLILIGALFDCGTRTLMPHARKAVLAQRRLSDVPSTIENFLPVHCPPECGAI
jgi:hypothetical protein